MWTWLFGAALAANATLHVGVHRDAGTLHDIAADGAAGQCTVLPSALSCPAEGPVSFRWGGPEEWRLTGAQVVEPGAVGVAWVLADEGRRAAERARLGSRVQPADIHELFVRDGSREPPPPSMGMVQDLIALTEHPDLLVRLEVLDALVPFFRHTASDPFDVRAPPLVPPGVIERLSRDPEWRVRRRLANRLREVRQPGDPLQEEALTALIRLTRDPRPPVTRAAMASLSLQARHDDGPAGVAWARAMERVRAAGPPGRAAANTLGHMARRLEPSAAVDPVEAVHLVRTHHLERTWNVWFAWREHVPFEPSWVLAMLRDTVGIHRGLLRHWQREVPAELEAVLQQWEPAEPHSPRYLRIRALLPGPPAPVDSLSQPGPGSEGK